MVARPTSELKTGTVIAVRPRRVQVRVGDEAIECDVRRGLLHGVSGQRRLLAVGDRVHLELATSGRGILHEVLPRRSKISRLGSLRPRREHVIATNIDQLLALQSAALPRFNARALDRYLVIGEVGSVSCAIGLNKIDLAEDAGVATRLAPYREIGYPVFHTSAVDGTGLHDLTAYLRGRVTILVGPSGVGKTSLLNRLAPGSRLATGEVSAATQRGVHTTTRVDYVSLPNGGAVLDSPGLRALQPWTEPEQLAEAFPEMRSLIGECRFRNCLHDREEGCAMRRAVEQGCIAETRFDSYRRILAGLIADRT